MLRPQLIVVTQLQINICFSLNDLSLNRNIITRLSQTAVSLQISKMLSFFIEYGLHEIVQESLYKAASKRIIA